MTGGRLKTPADADAESLQAKWIGDLAELSLRANDVIPLVDRGRQFAMRRPNDPWYNLQVNIFARTWQAKHLGLMMGLYSAHFSNLKLGLPWYRIYLESKFGLLFSATSNSPA